ncbi:MAG: mechanosensitive ion channel [Clostridiales bacterium]|nr:mechanosensitive ion channel [Clostridiales bacterium]
MSWDSIWNTIKTFFTDNLWDVILFFASIFIGLVVVKIILNVVRRMLSNTKMEKVTQSFIFKIVKFALYLFLIMAILSMIGISMTGIVTAISACVLAVGMALQNNIANLANGIVIVTSKIFKKGDFVEVDGVSGSVEDINFLFTTITTTDNKRVTIPNSAIVDGAMTNYGANPTRRVDFTFSVAYESDVELVKKVILDVINSNGKVRVLDKTPFCRLKKLNASSLDFFAHCWVDAEDYWDVYYYVVENVYNEFKRNKISVPFNQLEVRERKDEVVMPVIETPLPSRVEKIRITKKKMIDLEKDDLVALFKKNVIKKDNRVKMNKTKKSTKDSATKIVDTSAEKKETSSTEEKK